MEIFTKCLITFIACYSISVIYNVRGRLMIYAAIGGATTFFFYLITSPLDSVVMQSFFASLVASIYSESLARLIKVPATTFLIISIIPLVPGSNLYRTMEFCINSQFGKFASSALETLGIAGSIALGILLVSSVFRFAYVIMTFKPHIHKK